MIKIAQITDDNYVANIFSIPETEKDNIDNFIKNKLNLDGKFITIDEKNSKNLECGVGFFYDVENNFFSIDITDPFPIFDNEEQKYVYPNYLNAKNGQEKNNLYQHILDGIPKNITWMKIEQNS